MATIDQVKKHYDKLADRERFALLVAAAGRDDDAEIKELQRTAPRKHVSYPSTIGLSEGFRFAGYWYMLQQQSDMMTLFWMFSNGDTFQNFDVVFEGRKIQGSYEDLAGLLVRRVLGNHIAWVELCNDYKIDPAAMLKDFPRFDVMQMMIGILDIAAGDMGPDAQPSHDEITKALEGMRATIEYSVKDWA